MSQSSAPLAAAVVGGAVALGFGLGWLSSGARAAAQKPSSPPTGWDEPQTPIVADVQEVVEERDEGEDADAEPLPPLRRRRSSFELAVEAHTPRAQQLLAATRPMMEEIPEVREYIPDELRNAIFCGHLAADLDSVAGAIAAAHLFGGRPAVASELNSETEWALKQWGMEAPPRIEDLAEEASRQGTLPLRVCLVDHQQTTQVNNTILSPTTQVVGVIDHHAFQSHTLQTDAPIFVDVRPWGSSCTILAHYYLSVLRLMPPRDVAGMMLCAVVSDTLFLQSPTTTYWDRLITSALCRICDVTDPDKLAEQQFKAKSMNLLTMTPHSLVVGDMKSFVYNTGTFDGSVGVSVIETVDPAAVLERLSELLPEIRAVRKERGFETVFLAVVDIVRLRSSMVVVGASAQSLLAAAFDGLQPDDNGIADLGSRVSRKKDIIPAISAAIAAGWTPPAAEAEVEEDLGFVAMDPAANGLLVRQPSTFGPPINGWRSPRAAEE